MGRPYIGLFSDNSELVLKLLLQLVGNYFLLFESHNKKMSLIISESSTTKSAFNVIFEFDNPIVSPNDSLNEYHEPMREKIEGLFPNFNSYTLSYLNDKQGLMLFKIIISYLVDFESVVFCWNNQLFSPEFFKKIVEKNPDWNFRDEFKPRFYGDIFNSSDYPDVFDEEDPFLMY